MASKADKDLLKIARSRFKRGLEMDQPQRQREEEALKFYAGDQWPQDILAARQGRNGAAGGINQGTSVSTVPARPTITINLTREPVRQVLNQERQADLGISLVPADDFGAGPSPITAEEVELREGIIRRIQRDSEANDARTWAFNRAVIAGRGYYGVMTRYAPGKTADQEIYVERFYNQSCVLLDPDHEQPDGSDCNWGFTWNEKIPWGEYKETYPRLADRSRNQMVDWSSTDFALLETDERDWFTWDEDGKNPVFVRIANYWYVEWEGRDLAMFPDGNVAWKDELGPEIPEDAYQTRRSIERKICWVKTDGVNVLDEQDWIGHYIPIIKVLAEELQPFNGNRQVDGLIAPAIEACRASNYMVSKWVESVGLAPLATFALAEGQDEGYETEWNSINTRTIGRVHYKQVDLDGRAAPPPGRLDNSTDVGAVAGAVQLFGELVNKVMSIPDTSLGHVDPTVKSGKLAKLLIDRGLLGTSHYLDNLARSMRHEGRIENDLLYPIYGQRPGRILRLMTGEGEHESVLIGQPMIAGQQGPQPAPQGQPDAKTYTLTPDVEFSVAVKVSKSFDTRREEEADLVGQMIQAEPTLMQVFGDLYFKNLDGPGAKEMAERMEVMLAPQVQQLLKKNTPIPPEIQAQLAQMQQQMQELAQLADKNKADLQKTQMQESAETDRERMRMQIDAATNRADNETKLAVAELGAKVDRLALFLEERARVGLQQHELSTQTAAQQHEREMGTMGHEQAMQQASQQGVIASQQAEQQAALNPPSQGA